LSLCCPESYRHVWLTDIDQRLRQLRSFKRMLTDLTQRCAGRGPRSDCPLIESLTGGDEQ